MGLFPYVETLTQDKRTFDNGYGLLVKFLVSLIQLLNINIKGKINIEYVYNIRSTCLLKVKSDVVSVI